MKVLHITNAYPLKSYASYGIFIKEQIESIINLGINCDVLFINSREKGNLEYFRCFIKNYKSLKKYDIIHFHHPYSAFLFLLFKFKMKYKAVTSFLGAYNSNGLSLISKFVITRSDIIIIKNDKNITSDNSKKIIYLPNGVDLDFFKPIPKEECLIKLNFPDAEYILFVSSGGTNRNPKRYDLFSETLRILNEKYGFSFKELLLTSAERSLVPYFFNLAKLHLLTSDHEGSPNSVKEALACNIPVVSTNVGNVNDMLIGVEGCYVSENNDPKILADLVMKSLKNKKIEGRQALLKNELDMVSVANKIIEIYKNLILY